MSTSPKRIIVRAPNWVGDAVMSFPFFASLRATTPSSSITCLCRPNLESLMRDLDAIDDVIPLDESRGRSGLASVRRNAEIIREGAFDLAISLPTSFGSALMLWLARIPIRIGHAAEGRSLLLTQSRPYGSNGRRPHRTEGYLALLPLAFATPSYDRELRFTPSDKATAHADEAWRQSAGELDAPVLAIAPQAAQPNKMWPSERFIEIGRRWIRESGGGVILVGGPADQEACDQLTRAIGEKSTVNFAGAGDLSFTAAVLLRADAFLGNDSGLAHLAASVGLPVVVISGPGDPREVAPFSKTAITIKHPLFCSPCYKNECWRTDAPIECLTKVQTDEVWSHMQSVLAARRKN